MSSADDGRLDTAIRAYYGADKEEERLFVKLGRLELARTHELVHRHLPPAPLTILDVGGGTGVYAAWLSGLGYRVHLVDPVPIHVERALARARQESGTESIPTFTAAVGDARRLAEMDASTDVVLLFGPLYHLIALADRQAALVEARRVLRPGGLLFAVAISKFAPLLDGLRQGWLADPEFRQIVERDLAEGQHRNPCPADRPEWFTTAYLHHPDQIAREVSAAGFTVDVLYGIEGPGWPLSSDWDDPSVREQILYAARAVEREPTLIGMSPHLLAVAAPDLGPGRDPGTVPTGSASGTERSYAGYRCRALPCIDLENSTRTMMNSESRTTKSGALAALTRGATHTLILAALGLAIALMALAPSAATAQVATPEQVEQAEQAEPIAEVDTPPAEVQLQPGDVQLRVGETATFEGGALQLSMMQVGEDSRCPMDVMCVWMGRAVVGLHVVLDGVDRGDVNVTLYPGPQTRRSPDLDATVDRYVISLADLQPYPQASQPRPLDQRVATIRVTAATP